MVIGDWWLTRVIRFPFDSRAGSLRELNVEKTLLRLRFSRRTQFPGSHANPAGAGKPLACPMEFRVCRLHSRRKRTAASGGQLRRTSELRLRLNRPIQPRLSDQPPVLVANICAYFHASSDKRERGRLRAGASTKLPSICRRRRRLEFLLAILRTALTKSQQASRRDRHRLGSLVSEPAGLFRTTTATDKNPSAITPLNSSNAARHSSGIGIRRSLRPSSIANRQSPQTIGKTSRAKTNNHRAQPR
jgi:hypothetical protein